MPARFASLYGSGAYSSCNYNCPAPPTVITLPSGLQIAINLTSGQRIPLAGYDVTVTPLNGLGTTIQKAVFYIDGQLAFTAVPDNTGTARWHWVPASVGDVQMRVVVYGNDGSQTTYIFSLHVVAGTVPGQEQPQGQGSTGQTQSAGKKPATSVPVPVLQRLGHAIRHAVQGVVRHIPIPVVYSFPYVLFALLGMLLLFFALQVRREIQAVLRLRHNVLAEQHIAKEKETFLQLSEHYLRTPITLIRGGAEALAAANNQTPVLPPAVVQRIGELGGRLHDSVEAAISRLTSNELLAGIPNSQQSLAAGKLWLSTGFLVPVAGFVALLGITQYLVQNIRQLNVTAVNQFVQATIAGLLLVAFYEILRRRRLRRREVTALRQSLEYQRAVDGARNDFIHDNVMLFSSDVQQLLAALPDMPGNATVATVREGCLRFRKVISQFIVASSLAIARSQDPLEPVDVAGVFAQAEQMAAKPLTTHRTKIQTQSEIAQIYCRQPQWLPFVLASLLDNAASYSPDAGVVELGAAADHFYVADHGAGIAPDALRELFKPFTKGEGAMDFTHQGLGFSLYLDKLIMTYVGGDITAQSAEGKGTTMTLLLPQAAPAAA